MGFREFYSSFWNFWRFTDNILYFSRKLFRVWFLAYLGWSVYDLFGSPELKQAVEDAKRGNKPVEKTVEELQIEEEQNHCRHLYQIRGLWNFFCPFCGKKLLEGEPPRWQI